MDRQSGARGFPIPDGNLRAAVRHLEKSVKQFRVNSLGEG